VAHPVLVDLPDQVDHQELAVVQDHQVLLGQVEHLDIQVLTVHLVHPEHQDQVDLQEQVDHQEHLVLVDLPDQVVLQELVDLMELQVHQDRTGKMEYHQVKYITLMRV
jgi:hypothetical protein